VLPEASKAAFLQVAFRVCPGRFVSSETAGFFSVSINFPEEK